MLQKVDRTMDINEILLTLLNIKGIGNSSIRKMIDSESFHNMCLDMLFEILENNNTNKKNDINYQEIMKANDKAKDDLEIALNSNIKIINIFDKEFPIMLNNSTNPPVILFYKGDISYINDIPGVAIIGTRNPSITGEKISSRYAEYLTEKEFMIISGLAKGIDAEAHRACLESNGKTVAFIAHGLNKPIYPKENTALANEILKSGGAIISEFLPNEEAKNINFVKRDRLQSGLAKGVIVIETKKDGGSMHAAKDCLKLNKPLGVLEYPSIDKMRNDDLNGNIELLTIGGIPLYTKESIDNYLVSLSSTYKLDANHEKEKQIEFDF